MSFQICHCGTQAGYPHAYDCPRPYYRDDERGVREWKAERREMLCSAGDCFELRSEGEFCASCAAKLADANVRGISLDRRDIVGWEVQP